MSTVGRAPRFQRAAILAEGDFDLDGAKTAVGVIRYGMCQTVAVINSGRAGQDVGDIIGVGHGIPVVGSLHEALRFEPDSLVIGIAPRGGRLPESWRETILHAAEAGLDLLNGLHSFLSDDAEIASAAAARGVVICDVRRPPAGLPVAEGVSAALPNNVVLTVGTDCCVGKMTVALELQKAARESGLSADFVATGQTGILIRGRGISVDACVADFIAGAAEQMVLEAARDADWIFVEGQGSLYHPGYSGVTFELIHGTMPKQMVLCHHVTRPEIRSYGIAIPPLAEVVRYHEEVCRPLFPTRVSAIALNTFHIPEDEALEAITAAERETGLPADDCVRFGGHKLLRALRSNA